MFTGLIEAVGIVESIRRGAEGMQIVINSPVVAAGLAIGDSVNVDGVCQTVIAADASSFTVEAVGDTLEKTTFRRLKQGAKVNLEQALRADGRLGGHMVMGHVTGAARVRSWAPRSRPERQRRGSMVSGSGVGSFLVRPGGPRGLDCRGWNQPHGGRGDA